MSEQQFTHLPYNNGEYQGLYLPHDVARERAQEAGESFSVPELIIPTDKELKESIAGLDLGPLRNDSPESVRAEVLDRSIDDMLKPKNILDLKANFDSRKERIAQEQASPFAIADKDGSKANSLNQKAASLKKQLIEEYTQIGAKKNQPMVVSENVKTDIANLMGLSYEDLEAKAVGKKEKPSAAVNDTENGSAAPALEAEKPNNHQSSNGPPLEERPSSKRSIPTPPVPAPTKTPSPLSEDTSRLPAATALEVLEEDSVSQQEVGPQTERYNELVMIARAQIEKTQNDGLNPEIEDIDKDVVNSLRNLAIQMANGDQKRLEELTEKSYSDIFGEQTIRAEIINRVKADVSPPEPTETLTGPEKLTYRRVGKTMLLKALIWARLAEYQDNPISRSGRRKLYMSNSMIPSVVNEPKKSGRISRAVENIDGAIMGPLRHTLGVGPSQAAAEDGYGLRLPVARTERVEPKKAEQSQPQALDENQAEGQDEQVAEAIDARTRYPANTEVIVKLDDGRYTKGMTINDPFRSASGMNSRLVVDGKIAEAPIHLLDQWAAEANALDAQNRELVTA